MRQNLGYQWIGSTIADGLVVTGVTAPRSNNPILRFKCTKCGTFNQSTTANEVRSGYARCCNPNCIPAPAYDPQADKRELVTQLKAEREAKEQEEAARQEAARKAEDAHKEAILREQIEQEILAEQKYEAFRRQNAEVLKRQEEFKKIQSLSLADVHQDMLVELEQAVAAGQQQAAMQAERDAVLSKLPTDCIKAIEQYTGRAASELSIADLRMGYAKYYKIHPNF